MAISSGINSGLGTIFTFSKSWASCWASLATSNCFNIELCRSVKVKNCEKSLKIKKSLFGYYYLEYEKNIKKKKIILYAPTYRANQHETGVGYTYKEEVDFEKMRKQLGEDYIILFRPHYFIANQFDFDKYEGFVYDVSKIDDINELYVISDILITDYSSVFFDYANLKRPMIFYMYDLEHYRDESNGFYIDVEEELPGRIIRTDDDLIDEIKRVSNEFEYDEKYKRFNEKYNYLNRKIEFHSLTH